MALCVNLGMPSTPLFLCRRPALPSPLLARPPAAARSDPPWGAKMARPRGTTTASAPGGMLPNDRATLRNLVIVILASSGSTLALGTTCLGRGMARPQLQRNASEPPPSEVRATASRPPPSGAASGVLRSGQVERRAPTPTKPAALPPSASARPSAPPDTRTPPPEADNLPFGASSPTMTMVPLPPPTEQPDMAPPPQMPMAPPMPMGQPGQRAPFVPHPPSEHPRFAEPPSFGPGALAPGRE